MNNNLSGQLFNILDQEYECYSRLKEIAVAKKESLIENDIERLAELLQGDEELVRQINELEKERTGVIGRLTVIDQPQTVEITFDYLLGLVSTQEERERLSSLADKLRNVLEELHIQNEQNRLLLEEAMQFNNFSLQKFIEVVEPYENIYSPDGSFSGTERITKLLDKKG